MRLSDLFGMLKINAGEFSDSEITDISCSTDKLKEGGLFFALKGAAADGHDFVARALEKGAAAAIGEEDLPIENYYRVQSSRRSFAEAISAFYGNPGRELRLCGVTGTNGKTTVTNMIRDTAISAGIGCGLIGTVESIAGGRRRIAERTTPGPEDLYPLLREMADSGDKLCVMEVSSHGLAGDRVWGLGYEVGIFTNLTQDHLDYHKTMEAYAEAKAKLMEMSRLSVINADDPRAEFFISRSNKVITYGIEDGEFRAENIVCSPEKLSFTCPIGMVELPTGGKFSVYNALAAICGAIGLGIPEKSVLRGMSLFKGVPGRLELLQTLGSYDVYIDYAHTPDGLENVLRAIREFAPRRVITVFGCGGDRDRSKRPLMGEIASTLSDFCIVTSDNPRTEPPMDIIADVISGVKGDSFIAEKNRPKAIYLALDMAEEGDIVLLAGKGHETYQILGNDKIHMDEREIVREYEKKKSLR